MIKSKNITLTIILFLFSIFVFSFENTTSSLTLSSEIPFKVIVSMDKQTFENDESILLYMNIKNRSEIKKTFWVYEGYITFRPVVYDMKGREAETLVDYRLQNKSAIEASKDEKPDIINLSNNEIFTYVVDLRSIYKIEPGIEYRVKALFSPEADNDVSFISDNQLTFKNIAAASDIRNSGITRIKKFSSPDRALTPSEVVVLLLKAEKERDWDNYFKFINIEQFINAYPDYVRIYNNAIAKKEVELKEKILLEFIDFLKTERRDYIISYKIQNELKRSENNIYVEALIKRFASNNPSVYKYRYLLEKHENLWLITDVEVSVAKGQKL
jgi:hypothetical protein